MQSTLEIEITNLLHQLGISANLNGYRFLREEIKMTVEDFSVINSITKELYPSVAKKFDTTPSRVERATRHAIEKAWNKGDPEILTKLFGYTIDNQRGKPTNSEFIATIADKLILNTALLKTEEPFIKYAIYQEDKKYGIYNDKVKTKPVFFEKQWAEYFVNTINEIGDVSSVHLNDILEDFLVSYSF